MPKDFVFKTKNTAHTKSPQTGKESENVKCKSISLCFQNLNLCISLIQRRHSIEV